MLNAVYLVQFISRVPDDGPTWAETCSKSENIYRILQTIRRTLIFKQFFKKYNIFTIFIIRLQSQTKKKILSL
jgi:hypothetical protein